MDVVLKIIVFFLSLVVLGIGTERGTELVKEVLRWVGGKVSWLDFSKKRGFILAAILVFGVQYFFQVDLTHYLDLLDGFDPRLVELVNALLVLFVSNQVHNRFTPPSAG